MNKRLGKGIEALIKTRDLNQDGYLDGFMDIDKIKTNPNQPRKYFDEQALKNLVDSIRQKGIIQPITIKDLGDDLFELISGERRLRAAKILNLKTIPAYIISVDSDVEKLELALIENIQRNDLNVLEEAEAYYVLKEKYNLTHKEIAERVGKSRVEITRTLDLRRLPNNIKEVLVENSNNPEFPFSKGHARAILALKNSMKIQSLFNRILKDKISVRVTEVLVKKANGIVDNKKNPGVKANSFLDDENLLSDVLSAKINIFNKKNNSGYIKITFQSSKDRARIINLIKSSKKWNKNLCNKFELVPKFINSIAYEK